MNWIKIVILPIPRRKKTFCLPLRSFYSSRILSTCPWSLGWSLLRRAWQTFSRASALHLGPWLMLRQSFLVLRKIKLKLTNRPYRKSIKKWTETYMIKWWLVLMTSLGCSRTRVLSTKSLKLLVFIGIFLGFLLRSYNCLQTTSFFSS